MILFKINTFTTGNQSFAHKAEDICLLIFLYLLERLITSIVNYYYYSIFSVERTKIKTLKISN